MNLVKLSDLIQRIPPTAIGRLKTIINNSSQVLLIGNGGSNSIASHMSVDYSKFLGKKCVANDSSPLLTMLINDYGMEKAYSKYVEYYATPNTAVVIISSSGNSENCVQAAYTAMRLGLDLVILSGFSSTNKLNSIESDNIKLKFWVDSSNYGEVEMAHHIFLHSIV